MNSRVAAQIGSGTIPYTYGILDPSERGSQEGAGGVREGSQVIIANPEDMVSVDAFAASGITVGTSPIEIIGPHTNPLPRCRAVVIQNSTDNTTVRIAHDPDKVVSEGFVLEAGTVINADRHIVLPIMHNVSVYAAAATGTATIRMLIY